MMHIVDLPVGTLEHVARYLATPTRGLFAVAIGNADDGGSSLIAGEQWDTLDFGEVEKDLAARLSDSDINAVLLCIDAVNTVRRLRLSGCVNITGVGLEPLRGSSVIEQIDLSLVGEYETPVLDPKPSISLDFLIPILDSIIANEDNKLRYLLCPQVWREERSIESEFHAFIVRYNEMCNSRGGNSCTNCNSDLDYDWIATYEDNEYGMQCFTCYKCMEQYCYECEVEGEGGESTRLLSFCHKCQRDYCMDCCKMEYCDRCELTCCKDCKSVVKCGSTHVDFKDNFRRYECTTEICCGCAPSRSCDHCERIICYERCPILLDTCDSCGIRKCNDCGYVPWCTTRSVLDQHSLCLNCIVNKFREGSLGCTECKLMAADFLLKENIRLQERVKELETENKSPRDESGILKENVRLLERVKELETENKLLRDESSMEID